LISQVPLIITVFFASQLLDQQGVQWIACCRARDMALYSGEGLLDLGFVFRALLLREEVNSAMITQVNYLPPSIINLVFTTNYRIFGIIFTLCMTLPNLLVFSEVQLCRQHEASLQLPLFLN
jgi:hypothetical protein